MIRVAVLDDYQGVASAMADWSVLGDQVQVTSIGEHLPDEDQAVARLDGFDVICLMRERMRFPKSLIVRLPRLKLLAFTGLRQNTLDVAAAVAQGITVCSTRGGETQHCTTEMTWGLILAAARHLPQEDRAMRAGRWQTTLGITLHGRTLGILGLGRLGSRVARIGHAFGMQVQAWSPTLDDARAALSDARRVELETLFETSDIISVHLAMSEQTRHLVNADRIARMRPGAILVNTARGEIIDEDALVLALQQKRLGGAALDVFQREPLPASHPLLALDNVVLSPHLGYVTEETYRIFFHDTVENIACYLKGAPVRVVLPS